MFFKTNSQQFQDQTPPPKRPCSTEKGEEEDAYERMKLNPIADANQERIAVLDFGAQYGKVIDRRIRESRVLSEMMPLSTTAEEIMANKSFK